MGLSFRPGGASWSYNGYAALRHQIAAWEGIDLDQMKRFGGDRDWGGAETPLEPWLNSSDVQGFISGYGCSRMLPRLRAILKFMGEHLEPYDKSQLEALVRGMEHCAEHGCALSWG